ncbi:hypothetical protein N9W34_05660 [Rickettsiales bacterium]|nr:hypothetical protein [Rickettsiales bacterium]
MTIYKHDISNCFVGKICKSDFDDICKSGEKIISDIKRKKENCELPLLSIVEDSGDLVEIESIAKQINEKFSTLVVLGTGGSTLNPQMMLAVKPHAKTEVKFIDHVDPYDMKVFFSNIDPHKTAFLAISKSGRTTETIAQIISCLNWQDKNKISDKAEHWFFISDPGSNPLRDIAKKTGGKILDHHPDIGGRFATFSNVSLLPASVAGIDIRQIRKGASDCIENNLGDDSQALKGAAFSFAAIKNGINNNVLMPYISRMSAFTSWYRQIWAESLGKEGKGSTLINALGTLDQHSQLQLYLDGPKDKIFTLIRLENNEKNSSLANEYMKESDFEFFNNANLGDINNASEQATFETLAKYGCPVRQISIDRLDEYVMGALAAHSILEVLIMAEFLKVSAFGQPAVEAGKILMKDILNKVK